MKTLKTSPYKKPVPFDRPTPEAFLSLWYSSVLGLKTDNTPQCKEWNDLLKLVGYFFNSMYNMQVEMDEIKYDNFITNLYLEAYQERTERERPEGGKTTNSHS